MRNDANDLLRRAISARLQGRVQHSEILTREAILRAPNRTESHFELGVVLAAQARYPEAIASFREAIRLRGDVAEIHFRLALALQSQGDFSGAEESHRAALALAPEFLFAKQGLAAALTELGRESEAEAILRGLLDQNPGDPQLLAGIEHDLALCLSRQRRQGEALQHFDRALARGPDVSGEALIPGPTGESNGGSYSPRPHICANPAPVTAPAMMRSCSRRRRRRGRAIASSNSARALVRRDLRLPGASPASIWCWSRSIRNWRGLRVKMCQRTILPPALSRLT